MPSRPVPPSLDRRSELRATWDLLSRPDGFSLRRTYRMFVAAHGRPNELWFRSLLVDPTFVVYAPLVDTHDGRAGMDLAALPPLGRGGIDPEAALQFPGIFIRRAWPHPTPVPPSYASPQLQAALDALSNDPWLHRARHWRLRMPVRPSLRRPSYTASSIQHHSPVSDSTDARTWKACSLRCRTAISPSPSSMISTHPMISLFSPLHRWTRS